MGHGVPYKIKKVCDLLRSYLVDAERILLFTVEQDPYQWESFGDVRDLVSAQCRYAVLSEGREGAKGQGRFIFVCLNFSCILIKYDFYFTATSTNVQICVHTC